MYGRMVTIKISVLRLRIGNHIFIPTCIDEHPFLVSEFQIQHQDEIELLRFLGIHQVSFMPDRSATMPFDFIDIDFHAPVDTQAAQKLQAKLFQKKADQEEQLKKYQQLYLQAQQAHRQQILQARDMLNKIFLRPSLALKEAEEFIEHLKEQVLNAPQVHLHLDQTLDAKASQYSHLLNITTLAMILANADQMSSESIKEVGLAAFFHRMGKKFSLDQDESTFRHTPESLEKTLDLLKTMPDFSPSVLEIIAQHCERCDGSGFPLALDGKDIGNKAQIISLVYEFHVMCTALAEGTNVKTPYMALSTLYAHKKLQFNTAYLELLVKTIGVYPPGSIVRMSSKQIAVVVSVNSQTLLKPVVMVYEPKIKPHRTRLLDLFYEDLTIEQACSVTRMNAEERRYLLPKYHGFLICLN